MVTHLLSGMDWRRCLHVSPEAYSAAPYSFLRQKGKKPRELKGNKNKLFINGADVQKNRNLPVNKSQKAQIAKKQRIHIGYFRKLHIIIRFFPICFANLHLKLEAKKLTATDILTKYSV